MFVFTGSFHVLFREDARSRDGERMVNAGIKFEGLRPFLAWLPAAFLCISEDKHRQG